MKPSIGLAQFGFLALAASMPSYGALVVYTGNAYTSPNVRATWSALLPTLDWDSINFLAECVSPCAPTYNSGPATSTNISGTAFSGVTFAGANSGAGAGLFLRHLTGSRNNFYNGLTANGAYTQWNNGLATAQGVTGAPSITITLPTGTRSAGFDFGNINSTTAGITITATTASGHLDSSPGRYDVAAGSPSYASTGPGFYGVTSTEDILTISIIANASTNQWVLNLANFRYGIQLPTATPEPSTQLALGAALITISLLLRRRSKSARGGNA